MLLLTRTVYGLLTAGALATLACLFYAGDPTQPSWWVFLPLFLIFDLNETLSIQWSWDLVSTNYYTNTPMQKDVLEQHLSYLRFQKILK